MSSEIILSSVIFKHHKKLPPALTVESLRLNPGEVTAIIGKSGSGKTTLLRLIAGLAIPQEGTVQVGGLDLAKLSDAKRAKYRRQMCDVVFQDFALVEALTAGENIAFAARLAGRRSSTAVVEDALAQVGLEGMAARRVWELSGGQQQRVAIARALVKDGDLVLADEPTSALDEASTHMVMGALQHFAHVDRKPVIIVTHDPLVASQADRVITIDAGVITSDSATHVVPQAQQAVPETHTLSAAGCQR